MTTHYHLPINVLSQLEVCTIILTCQPLGRDNMTTGEKILNPIIIPPGLADSPGAGDRCTQVSSPS